MTTHYHHDQGWRWFRGKSFMQRPRAAIPQCRPLTRVPQTQTTRLLSLVDCNDCIEALGERYDQWQTGGR